MSGEKLTIKDIPITNTRHRVLIKKIDNLIAYANKYNRIIDNDFLVLTNFIKTNKHIKKSHLQAKNIEGYTKYYYISKTSYLIIAGSNELVRYSEQNNIKLCSMFLNDLEIIKDDKQEHEKKFIKTLIRKYIRNVWRENDLEKVKENYYYLMSKQRKGKLVEITKINKPIGQLELKGRHEKLFSRIEEDIDIPKLINEVKKESLYTEDYKHFEIINTVLYNYLKENTIKDFLYKGSYKIIRNFIIQRVSEGLKDLTKHDTNLDPSHLTDKEKNKPSTTQ